VPPGRELDHIDGNKQNNRLENLQLVTRSENVKRAFAKGLKIPASGSRHGMSKLTEAEVFMIRKLYASGKYKQVDLARTYKVSFSLIHLLVNGKGWRHVSLTSKSKEF